VIILECEQLSEEWFKEKAGKPSASKTDRIITRTGVPSKQQNGYLYELASEVITGVYTNSYQSKAMADGIEKEAGTRMLYEFIYDVEVEQVGMIYPDESKKYLVSPDGLIGREYGLELKNVLPKTQVYYLLNPDKLLDEYFVQVQTALLVTGFDRWDLMSNCDGMKPLILTINRDEAFLKKLSEELDKFCLELSMVINKLKD